MSPVARRTAHGLMAFVVLTAVGSARAEDLRSVVAALRRVRANHPSVSAKMEAAVRRGRAFYDLAAENALVPEVREYSVLWTYADGRLHSRSESQSVSREADGTARLTTATLDAIWDGKKETVLETDSGEKGSQTARIYGSPSNRSYPLGRVLGGVWIADLVDVKQYSVSDAPADTRFGRLVAVEGHSGKVTRRLLLAPDRDWLAVRTEEQQPSGGATRFELVTAERRGGAWLGMQGRYCWFEAGPGAQKPVTEITYRVTEARVGLAVADALFRMPHLRSGATVLDQRSRRIYGVGAGGEWVEQGILGDTSNRGRGPVQSSGWLFTICCGTLILAGARRLSTWKHPRVRS